MDKFEKHSPEFYWYPASIEFKNLSWLKSQNRFLNFLKED